MKIIILGDIHGRMIWHDIIQAEKPDKVIFMGDYISSHDDISSEQQCINLEDILNYKEDNPNNVILLRGNHDLQHLGYYWAECSGFFRGVYNWLSEPHIKERFLNLTQWIHIENNYIFSHAGISQTWWKSLELGDPTKDNILKINQLEPSPLFAFTPDRFSDYYGDSFSQPCTWIRPTALVQNALENWNQIVGHTRVNNPGNIILQLKSYKDNWDFNIEELWCVDALPLQYMIMEDGKYEMKSCVELNKKYII